MTLHYQCSRGHSISAPAGTYAACPVFVFGNPCPGQLTATGPGAREENARLAHPSTTHRQEASK